MNNDAFQVFTAYGQATLFIRLPQVTRSKE